MRRLALTALLAMSAALHAQTITDPNFTIDYLANPGHGTIAFDFGPGGRLYVAEKRGRVLVMQPNGSGGFNAPTEFADLTGFVNNTAECGLLGMRLDPDFATNRYMYLFYTTATDQRLVRLTADATYNVVSGGQTILLPGLPRSAPYHNAGDIEFHPSEPNYIYIALGDDGDIGNARNPDFYAGKLLRVNKANGEGLAVNPYYTGSLTDVRSRVWAVGFRNPFRIAFHPQVPQGNALYFSENGGPQNMTTNQQDRIGRAEMGSDGHWDWTQFNAGDSSLFFAPANASGNDVTVMARDQASSLGIDLAAGGVFADPAFPGSHVMVCSNWLAGSGSIRRWRVTGTNLDTLTPIAADGGNRFVTGLYATDLRFGPDGHLYFTQSGGDASTGGWYNVGRIRRVGGTPPVASFTTNPTPATGNAPLNVQFTDTSTDADGTIATRNWNFGDGTTSTATNPTHLYSTPGVFTVTLTVQDNTGLQDTETTTVTVYQATALTLTGQVLDGRTGAGLAVATELRLYQDDGVTPLAFSGGLGAGGNGIAIAAGGTINSVVNVQITGSGVVVSAGEPVADGVAAQYIGFAVASAATTHSQSLTFRLSDTAIYGLVETTGGVPATVDLGVARVSPASLYAFSGGRDYLPASGIPASGVLHRVTTDALGWYYIPIGTGDGGVDFHFDVVADTGAGTYVSQVFTQSVATGSASRRDVVLGVFAGGSGRDDLTGIPVTPNVDYATQIQPIFDAQCGGCHNAMGGSAGLALLGSGSWANLVNGPSTQVTGMMLVQPFDAMQSYLFEKVNAAQPQVGVRMRVGGVMPLTDQALIRDWINQGALPSTGGGGGGGGGGSDSGSGCAVLHSTGSGWFAVVLAFAFGQLVLLQVRRRRVAASVR